MPLLLVLREIVDDTLPRQSKLLPAPGPRELEEHKHHDLLFFNRVFDVVRHTSSEHFCTLKGLETKPIRWHSQ